MLQAVREAQAVYVIETFGRPQAALINLGEYRRFQQYQLERESFFRWLDATAEANAARNVDLSEAAVLALIEQARTEVAGQS